MTPEELEAQRLAEEAEAQRLAEEAEAQRVAQEAAATNPMMQPTDLIGQQGQQETGMDTNPLLTAGLGLGGGYVASQTGGAPATSQVLSSLAQKVAAQDASRMASRNLPQLIGTPQTYQGVPTGPSTPPQFTGTAPARPIPGTQLAPPNQPPAVSSVGGAPANMKVAQRVGPPATIGAGAAATGLLARLNPYVGALTGGYLGGKAIDAFGGDALRAVGLTEREGNISDILGSSVGEAIYGDGNLPAFSNEELASIRGIDPNAPQMSRLGDEPLVFNAPTGPSSTVPQAAQLAETLPDDAGLMGAPGIQGTGIPTTTIDVDGGSATVPQALADQTFQTLNPMKEAEPGSPQAIFERIRAKGALSPELIAAGQARAEAMGTTFDPEAGFSRDAYLAGQADPGPMGRDATMDRLGGRTLNEYLNAPNGTEGVSGLRTDPQGRMIPGGFDNRADAYGSYEREAAAREARQAARPDFGATISDRERRGTGEMSMADATDMFGSSEAGRAAILRQRQGLNPVTGNRESTAEEQNQLSNR